MPIVFGEMVSSVWEQAFLAAATCAGSDYPMLAAHFGIPLDRVDFVVEGVFDPRGEFDGLGGFDAPPEARHCYRTLHFRGTLVSSAPREELRRIHERVLSHNMVLGALRGIPQTSELITPATAGGRRQKERVIPSERQRVEESPSPQ